MEKRNIYFGFWVLLVFSIVGMAVQLWLTKNGFMTPKGAESFRSLMKAAHSHALCFSFANILFGLSADVLIKKGLLRTIASWLLIYGLIAFPTALVMNAYDIRFYEPFVSTGAIAFLLGLAVALIGKFFVKKKA